MKLAVIGTEPLIIGLTTTFPYSLGLVRNEGIDVEQDLGDLDGSALYQALVEGR